MLNTTPFSGQGKKKPQRRGDASVHRLAAAEIPSKPIFLLSVSIDARNKFRCFHASTYSILYCLILRTTVDWFTSKTLATLRVDFCSPNARSNNRDSISSKACL